MFKRNSAVVKSHNSSCIKTVQSQLPQGPVGLSLVLGIACRKTKNKKLYDLISLVVKILFSGDLGKKARYMLCIHIPLMCALKLPVMIRVGEIEKCQSTIRLL